MITAGLVLAAVAAALHVYIFFLESLAWTSERTRRTFGIRTLEEAQTTRALAFNQGFYNLLLAVATALGIVLAVVGVSEPGFTLVFVGTASMLVASLVLLGSDRSKLRAAAVQGVPPLLAIVLLAVGLQV